MLTKISTHRNAIMGFSILWVMAYHSGISFPFHLPLLSPIASYIRSTGFGAVDIFMFISGFGLYHSLSHNSDVITFYKKRILRILPVYLPVLIVWLLLKLPSVPEENRLSVILNNLTGTAFWCSRSPSFNWYMPALIFFYLVAPVFFKFMGKRWREILLLIFTFLMDICFLGDYVMVAVSRLTIFVLGMIAGCWFVEKRQVSKNLEIFTYISALISYIALYYLINTFPLLMWPYGLYWYPFIFIAPAVIFLLCRLFSLLNATAIGDKIYSMLKKIGEYTLEIYLIHIVLFDYLNIESPVHWIAIFIIMVLCGYVYHTCIASSLYHNHNKTHLLP